MTKMVSILIPYGTGDGQTATVATRIATVLTERGFDVTTVNLSETAPSSVATTGDDAASDDDGMATADDGMAAFDVAVDEFDAVLVGASVNNGRHQPEVLAFVERNAEALAARPTGFFQLSLASVFSWRWARDGAREYVDRMVETTGWHPDRVGLFAGALRYTQYDRPMRWLFELAALVTGLGTDTSRDYEYTDWDEVERFAAEFGEFVEGELAAAEADERDVASGRNWRRAAGITVLGFGLATVVYRALRNRARGSRDVGPDDVGQRVRVRSVDDHDETAADPGASADNSATTDDSETTSDDSMTTIDDSASTTDDPATSADD